METPQQELAQWCKEIVDFSSQYGSETSISYTVPNIVGSSTIYPSYGDFTQACVLRTYGPWWSLAPSHPQPFSRTPKSFISQDFIDMWFETKVVPTHIEIYETYNPGAVVRILACNTGPYDDAKDHSKDVSADNTNPDNKASVITALKWSVLWSGAPEPAKGASRIFSPPLKNAPFATNLIRIEFNSEQLDYYMELDAVRLSGTRASPHAGSSVDPDPPPGSPPPPPDSDRPADDARTTISDRPAATSTGGGGGGDHGGVNRKQMSAEKVARELAQLHLQDGLSAALDVTDNGYFDLLPEEVLQLVVRHLDLPSLCALAMASRLFYKHCNDPLQNIDLDLQPYWDQVSDQVLEAFTLRCRHLQRLNLSWCGRYNTVTSSQFCKFLSCCGKELTAIRLACCRFVDNEVVKTIASCCPNLTELDLQCCKKVDGLGFISITHLPKLRRLNLYRSMLDVYSIIAIIRSCPDLEHLNIGSCVGINNFDDVAAELGKNCRNLKTLDLWRARTLTEIGFNAISTSCPWLEEIDLGWCTELRSDQGVFVQLVQRCRHLRKLYLTANRTVCDRDLRAFAHYGSALEQLDILGTSSISHETAKLVLDQCQKLRFLDVSFCQGVDFALVHHWRTRYPHVKIKKSFQAG